MNISHCDTDEAWNAFVERDERATVFHLFEWRQIIARAYRHEAHYLVAEEQGRLRGVLPLFLIKSRVFGKGLVSLPFADYGGILADSPATATALLEEALELGRKEHVDYLQFRHRDPVPGIPGMATDKVTMLLDLSFDPERIWARLPSERRNRIKKARRQGVAGRLVGADGLDRFYGVISENMRDIGSPVHSREFFGAILEELGPRAKVLLVEKGDDAIGAALCLFYRDTVSIPWVSSLRNHFHLGPNMVLYWTGIEQACLGGFRTLDFGRSSLGAGTYEFKRQWGATPVALAWRSLPLNGGRVPTFSGEGLRDHLFIECWKRLPLAISRHLGPRVRRLIPS